MIKRFWNYLLEQSATGCMWLALHLECWRVGHDWQAVAPDYAWCENCDDEVKGKAVRKLYEAKYGPYVESTGKAVARWDMSKFQIYDNIDNPLPDDTIYLLDMSKFGRLRDGSIVVGETGEVVAPPFGIVGFKNDVEVEFGVPGWGRRLTGEIIKPATRRCADS